MNGSFNTRLKIKNKAISKTYLGRMFETDYSESLSSQLERNGFLLR